MGGWRNKRMGEEGRGKGTLDARTLALIRVATAIAKGDEAVLRERMTAARAAHVPTEWVDELLLQSLLNVGHPLTLMAFGVRREAARPWAKAGGDIIDGHVGRAKGEGVKVGPRGD